MPRRPGRARVVVCLLLAGALLTLSACSMFNSNARNPVKKPGPKTPVTTGMIPAKLQSAAALHTPINWKDFQTLNPKLMHYKKVGTDQGTGAALYGPDHPDASGYAPGIYVLVGRDNNVLGVRTQLPGNVKQQPWYDSMPGATGSGGASGASNNANTTGNNAGNGTNSGGSNGNSGNNSNSGSTTPSNQNMPMAAGPTMTAYVVSGLAGTGATKGNGNLAPGTNGSTDAGTGGTSNTNATGTNGANNGNNGTKNNGNNTGTVGNNTGNGATGGGANVAVKSVLTSLDTFKRANPSWKDIKKMTDWTVNMGFHYGHPGPGMALMVDHAGNVTAFEASIPAMKDGSGWEPYYDQLPGKPMYDPKTGKYMWSEHVYFMLPESIR